MPVYINAVQLQCDSSKGPVLLWCNFIVRFRPIENANHIQKAAKLTLHYHTENHIALV